MCSIPLDVSTVLRDVGSRASFVAFGSAPSFSEAVFLPRPPFSVWSSLQAHAKSAHTLTSTSCEQCPCHTCSIAHSSKHIIFFSTTGALKFPYCSGWEERLLRGRGSKRKTVCHHYIKGCLASKAVGSLAQQWRHTAPLQFEFEMIKTKHTARGSLKGLKLYLLLPYLNPLRQIKFI